MSKRLQVIFDDEEYAQLQAAARRARMTVSDWVRRALRRERGARPEGGREGGVREAGVAYGAGDWLDLRELPGDAYDWLAERARRQRRTVAQEAAWLLERALEPREPLSLLELDGLGAGVWESVDAAEHVARERDAWD